jgi:hypothetical protein
MGWKRSCPRIGNSVPTFQPSFLVGVQPLLVIVDENGRGNVHGIDECYAFLNVALLQGGLDLRGDIEKPRRPGVSNHSSLRKDLWRDLFAAALEVLLYDPTSTYLESPPPDD